MGQAHVAVIGAGSWGTAMAIHLAHCGHTVSLVARDPQMVQSMGKMRENSTYLPRMPFPDALTVSADINQAVEHASTVMLMVPSQAFSSCIQRIAPVIDPKTLVCWGSKGLGEINSKSVFLHEVAENVCGKEQLLAVIGGPSFAKEVASHIPTAVVVASAQSEALERSIALLHHDSMRCYSSADIAGVELCGVTKNVLAVAAGVSDGLALGANTRSALITRGLAEMQRLGVKLNAHPKTFMGLAGVGDVVLSCTSDLSRNRRLGLGLGRGQTLQDTVKTIGQVVESIDNVSRLLDLARQCSVSLPITEQVQAILQGRRTPQQALTALLARPPVAELDDIDRD